MEQSKLISGMILKLKVAYPYFFKDLEDEEFVALTKMYQEQIIGFLNNFCGYTMGEGDLVRRNFEKKLGTESHIPKIKGVE